MLLEEEQESIGDENEALNLESLDRGTPTLIPTAEKINNRLSINESELKKRMPPTLITKRNRMKATEN